MTKQLYRLPRKQHVIGRTSRREIPPLHQTKVFLSFIESCRFFSFISACVKCLQRTNADKLVVAVFLLPEERRSSHSSVKSRTFICVTTSSGFTAGRRSGPQGNMAFSFCPANLSKTCPPWEDVCLWSSARFTALCSICQRHVGAITHGRAR